MKRANHTTSFASMPEHFESTQVVLKLKETQAHKRTPTYTKMSVSREGLRSKGLCGLRRG